MELDLLNKVIKTTHECLGEEYTCAPINIRESWYEFILCEYDTCVCVFTISKDNLNVFNVSVVNNVAFAHPRFLRDFANFIDKLFDMGNGYDNQD